MAIRFLHTADAHFGVENYGFIDSHTGLHTRLLDFRKSFEYMVNYAISEQLDLFVFAGDAYKNSCPSPTHQRILIKLFLKLLHNNIPVVIVVGNHDHPGSQIKAHALDIFYHIRHPLCFIFSKPQIALIPTKRGRIQVIGIPWPFPAVIAKGRRINEKDIKTYVLSQLGNLKKNISDDYPTILAAHITMNGGVFSGSEKSILEGKDPLFSISEIHDEKISYTALGHLHRAQYINKKYPDQNPIIYSGSPDRIDFGEKDDKKVCSIVTVEKNKKTEFFLLPIDCRPFYQINIHINTLDEVEQKIKSELSKYENLKNAIVKIKYSYNYEYIKYFNVSLLQYLVSHVWHVASIECINKYKIKKKENVTSIAYQDKNILAMVETYIEKNESFKNDKNLYLQELKEYTSFLD